MCPSLPQIRGFLSVQLPFPLTRAEATLTSLSQFQSLVRAAYRQSGERGVVKRQRQRALLEAYHSVPRALLARVRRYVSEDCDLFGYDCSLESRFNLSARPPPLFRFDAVLSAG